MCCSSLRTLGVRALFDHRPLYGVVAEMIAAFLHAHVHGLAHMGLCPQHLLCTDLRRVTPGVKLLGFGLIGTLLAPQLQKSHLQFCSPEWVSEFQNDYRKRMMNPAQGEELGEALELPGGVNLRPGGRLRAALLRPGGDLRGAALVRGEFEGATPAGLRRRPGPRDHQGDPGDRGQLPAAPGSTSTSSTTPRSSMPLPSTRRCSRTPRR